MFCKLGTIHILYHHLCLSSFIIIDLCSDVFIYKQYLHCKFKIIASQEAVVLMKVILSHGIRQSFPFVKDIS